MASLRIDGMKDIAENLRKLPLTVKEKVARRAVSAGAQTVRRATEAEIASQNLVESGLLSRSIRTARRKKGIAQDLIVYVMYVLGTQSTTGKRRQRRKARGGKAVADAPSKLLPYYWYMLEFGWHRGGKFFRRPFIVPALAKSAQSAAEAIRDTAKKSCEREIKKVMRVAKR